MAFSPSSTRKKRDLEREEGNQDVKKRVSYSAEKTLERRNSDAEARRRNSPRDRHGHILRSVTLQRVDMDVSISHVDVLDGVQTRYEDLEAGLEALSAATEGEAIGQGSLPWKGM